jgi:undecaprenyl-diphosphatase
VAWDKALFRLVNDLAGHFLPLDRFMAGLADDYFMVISICLVLVAMWFGTRRQEERARNQRTVLLAMAGMGIATGLVALANLLFVREHLLAGSQLAALFNRPRPYLAEPAMHLVWSYRPTDPSFPSNLAAVVFGLALGVWVKNRTVGWWLLLLAALACFARVYVGLHYPGDILGGFLFAALGVGIASLLFWLFRPVLDFLLWLLTKLHLAG